MKTNTTSKKPVKKDQAIKPIKKASLKATEKVTESDSHKQRIETICNHLLENKEKKKALLKHEKALAERKLDLKRELVDKILYKRVNGEKERMDGEEEYFNIILNCGFTEDEITDIVEDIHYREY